MDRLFHFEFDGVPEKITVQAQTSGRARGILYEKIRSLPQYKDKDVIQETTESLVTGVSTRMIKGKKYTWNGFTWQQN